MNNKYVKIKIETKGKCKAEPCIIEAPSPGSAIEYFLIIHGMLWYDIIEWEETDEDSDANRKEFNKLMGNLSKKEIGELDKHHLPYYSNK